MVKITDFDTVAIITPSAHFDHSYTILDKFKKFDYRKTNVFKKVSVLKLKEKANEVGKRVFPYFKIEKSAVLRVARELRTVNLE